MSQSQGDSFQSITRQEILLLALLGIGALCDGSWLVWWGMAWAWSALRFASSATPARSEERPADATTMRTLLAMTMVFVALLLTPCTAPLVLGHSRGESQVFNESLPLYLSQEFQRREIEGPIFVPLDWADYLVWQTKGAVQPLGLNPGSLQTYQSIFQREAGWKEALDQQGIHFIALSHKGQTPLRNALLRDSRSLIRYQDQKTILIEWL